MIVCSLLVLLAAVTGMAAIIIRGLLAGRRQDRQAAMTLAEEFEELWQLLPPRQRAAARLRLAAARRSFSGLLVTDQELEALAAALEKGQTVLAGWRQDWDPVAMGRPRDNWVLDHQLPDGSWVAKQLVSLLKGEGVAVVAAPPRPTEGPGWEQNRAFIKS